MYVIVKDQVGNYTIEEDVALVVRVADYSIPSGITNTYFNAKGDLLIGTGPGAFAVFPVGADGTYFGPDSSQASGWNFFTLSSSYLTKNFISTGFLLNGYLEVTVASNNITLTVKTLAGNSPTTGDPVHVRLGSTIYTITSALSITKNAGTNWFNNGASESATYARDYFVYFTYNTNASTLDFGFSQFPDVETYADCSSTSTARNYFANANGSAPAASDTMFLVGRFTATLSASASYNWSVSGSGNVKNFPIRESQWQTYKPTYTGFSSAPSNTWSYKLRQDEMAMEGNTTAAASNTTGFTMTAMFNSANNSYRHPMKYQDNSVNATTPGTVAWESSGYVFTFRTDWATGAWTNANNKSVAFLMPYRKYQKT